MRIENSDFRRQKTEDGMQKTEYGREKTVTEIPLPSINGLRRASALCIGALLLSLAAPLRAEVVDRVMAVVGSAVVTLSDVRAAEAFSLAPGTTTAEVLAALIDRELMLGEVDRYAAPDADPAVLDRRLAQIQARFPSRALFEQALARTAMTEVRLRAVVSENLRIETYADQQVISTGPYAVVRHPMYAGTCMLYVTTPLALGSWWSVLPALAFIPVFVLRIRNEEEVLVRELAGYDEYRKHVRHRLVPFVW